MVREILKNWKGCIDLKDYDVIECIRLGEDMTVIHKGKIMTLSPQSLDLKKMYTSPTKFPGKKPGEPDYYLYSYKWVPDLVEHD